jgi:hypothetical protein
VPEMGVEVEVRNQNCYDRQVKILFKNGQKRGVPIRNRFYTKGNYQGYKQKDPPHTIQLELKRFFEIEVRTCSSNY